MKERIQQLLNETGLTATRLADELKVQRSGISHILSGRNQPSYDFLVRLLNRFPDISADWLITGKGNMYKNITDNEELNLFQSPIAPLKIEKESKEDHKENADTFKVTNVNTQKIVLLKSDGTFELYKASDND